MAAKGALNILTVEIPADEFELLERLLLAVDAPAGLSPATCTHFGASPSGLEQHHDHRPVAASGPSTSFSELPDTKEQKAPSPPKVATISSGMCSASEQAALTSTGIGKKNLTAHQDPSGSNTGRQRRLPASFSGQEGHAGRRSFADISNTGTSGSVRHPSHCLSMPPWPAGRPHHSDAPTAANHSGRTPALAAALTPFAQAGTARLAVVDGPGWQATRGPAAVHPRVENRCHGGGSTDCGAPGQQTGGGPPVAAFAKRGDINAKDCDRAQQCRVVHEAMTSGKDSGAHQWLAGVAKVASHTSTLSATSLVQRLPSSAHNMATAAAHCPDPYCLAWAFSGAESRPASACPTPASFPILTARGQPASGPAVVAVMAAACRTSCLLPTALQSCASQQDTGRGPQGAGAAPAAVALLPSAVSASSAPPALPSISPSSWPAQAGLPSSTPASSSGAGGPASWASAQLALNQQLLPGSRPRLGASTQSVQGYSLSHSPCPCPASHVDQPSGVHLVPSCGPAPTGHMHPAAGAHLPPGSRRKSHHPLPHNGVGPHALAHSFAPVLQTVYQAQHNRSAGSCLLNGMGDWSDPGHTHGPGVVTSPGVMQVLGVCASPALSYRQGAEGIQQHSLQGSGQSALWVPHGLEGPSSPPPSPGYNVKQVLLSTHDRGPLPIAATAKAPTLVQAAGQALGPGPVSTAALSFAPVSAGAGFCALSNVGGSAQQDHGVSRGACPVSCPGGSPVRGTVTRGCPVNGESAGSCSTEGRGSDSCPVNNVWVGGCPVRGASIGGCPVSGASTGSCPVSGASTGSRPVSVASSGGCPFTGASTGGCPVSGASTAGCPVGGASTGSCPVSGASSGGCPVSGASSGGCPVSERSTGLCGACNFQAGPMGVAGRVQADPASTGGACAQAGGAGGESGQAPGGRASCEGPAAVTPRVPRRLSQRVMKFKGRMRYVQTAMEVDWQCGLLLQRRPPVVGLDIEWRPHYVRGQPQSRTALIQICYWAGAAAEQAMPRRLPAHGQGCVCLLLHVFQCGLTPQAHALLADENIRKVGVNIGNDAAKLMVDFGAVVAGVRELGDEANVRRLPGAVDIPFVTCDTAPRRWSLAGLAEDVLSQHLEKSSAVQCGNWERFPLTQQQQLYAALDAFASLAVYQSLQGLPTKSVRGSGQSKEADFL